MSLLTSIISKLQGLIFLAFFISNSFAQDLSANFPYEEFSLNRVSIKRNDFYYNNNKINTDCLSKLINSSAKTSQDEKIRLIDGIGKFQRKKNDKNAFSIIATSSFILGVGFSFLTYIQGGRTDVVILSAIFGTVGVGFTIGSVVESIKFKRKKKELMLGFKL